MRPALGLNKRVEGWNRWLLCHGGRRSAPGKIDCVARLNHAADVGKNDAMVDMGALVAKVLQTRIVELDGGIGQNKTREQVPDERKGSASSHVKRRSGGSGAFAAVRALPSTIAAELASSAGSVLTADVAHAAKDARRGQSALIETIDRNDSR